MVQRTDGRFIFITSEEVVEYRGLADLSSRESFARIALGPSRWDQAVNFAIERAEFEFLKAEQAGHSDPIIVVNVEEFQEVEDFSAPFNARNLKVNVLDRSQAIPWLADADRPVFGSVRIVDCSPGTMTLVVISLDRADVINRPAPAH